MKLFNLSMRETSCRVYPSMQDTNQSHSQTPNPKPDLLSSCATLSTSLPHMLRTGKKNQCISFFMGHIPTLQQGGIVYLLWDHGYL